MACGRCSNNRSGAPRQPMAVRSRPPMATNPADPTAHLNLLPTNSEFVQLDAERLRVEKLRRQSIRRSLGLG